MLVGGEEEAGGGDLSTNRILGAAGRVSGDARETLSSVEDERGFEVPAAFTLHFFCGVTTFGLSADLRPAE